MKKKAYIKNQIQIIRKTKARFLSIFCIVFLGAAFFAGLRHTSLIMKTSMDDYLTKYQINDLEYIATLGFNQNDIDKIKNIEQIEEIEYGNRFDALISYGENTKGVSVYSNQTFKNKINKLELVEGRLPSSDSECVIDYNFTVRNKVTIGDKITLSNDNGSKEFTVCGLVNDPRYFSVIERGTNSLGDGTNEAFVEILSNGNEEFALPQELYDLREEVVFNELRIKLKNPYDYQIFSDEYLDYVKDINQEITKRLDKEVNLVNQNLINDANNEIISGESKLSDGKSEYEAGLVKYNDGVKQYQDGLKEYEDGLAKYNDGYNQYLDGVNQYNAGKARFDQGLSEYLDGQKQFDQGLNKWQDGMKQYDQLIAQKQQLEGVYEQKQAEYDQAIASGVPEETLSELKAFLEQTKGQLSVLEGTTVNLKQQLDTSKIELNKNETILKQSQQTLEASRVQLDNSKEQLDHTKNTLAASKQQLDNAKKQLDDTKTLLDQTKIDLDNAKKELDDAAIKLEDGKKALEDIPTNELITLTRDENASVLSYEAACQSMAALAVVFPLIFFLVAALVSLTTMTRMVEEQRVQSGTFRALGYDKKDVIKQYLIYAFLATFIASVLGMIFGVYFFPNIIYYLYRKMLFTVGAPIHVVFNTIICLQTFIVSVAITLLVTYLVVHQELNEMPASLLRPKPPKMGKRIVLERITFIWQKLSFNQKVTMRNIFRYKKRFFMSVIGIAGCTALIVVGFGIKNSVSTLADRQYGEIWTYDGVVVFDKNLNNEQLIEQQEKFNDLPEIKDSSRFYRKTISILGDKDHYGTLEVFKDNQDLASNMNLEDYQNHDKLKLTNDGVIISAKLSELLDVKTGDRIKVKINDQKYEVKVNGIMLLHFQHHIYMSDQYYHRLTGENPIKNYTYFNLNNDAKQKNITEYCEQNENINSINYIRGISQGFRDQMGSINGVVLILIACAGALAFIVLYNLTNINIQERKSEIATIKVLGFYPREVYDYVFRENHILSIIGSLVGLGLGKIIHMFIIDTVEVEVAMFVRSVNLMSYLYAIVITIIFTSLINFVMRKVLKNIDMVESLKSIE